MAKQLVRSYVFTSGVQGYATIEIPGRYDLGEILIITNVTRNIILYNFADSAFAGTTITFNRGNSANFPTATSNSDGTTLITLAVGTVGQLSGDNIQIFVERNEVITRPWAMGTDAFERQRTANPRSMLDADFEYGLQPTKWQMIQMVRGAPSIYELPGSDLGVTAMITNASGGPSASPSVESLITVFTETPHGLTTGSVVTIQQTDPSVTGFDRAEGAQYIQTVTGTNVFTYFAKAKVGDTANTRLETSYTVVRKANFYTASSSTCTISILGSGASTTGTVTLTFPRPHGFIPGQGVIVVITSDNGSNNHTLCQGSFFIETVTTTNYLTYSARNVGSITGTPLGYVYVRPDGFFQHRPFDGGVQMGAGGPNHGSHAIRMSKKYLRYQSGKAINYNTAALFAPNYDVASVTATNTIVGSTIVIATDETDHGLQSGAVIELQNVLSPGYSGTYTVATVVTERIFTVTATNTLNTTTAVIGSPCNVAMVNWHGSTVRAGTFDDQNGMFWQYDGRLIALGLRASTFQISGFVSAVPNQSTLEGTNTRFRDQLKEGDRIVLKGMSYFVTNVTSATWITVSPPYRGFTATNKVKVAKTIETLVPQYQWNQDRCDGSNGPFNPSGYRLNPNKVQMIGLQWTWYGAGFIDWMLRGSNGNYITVHRMKHSNVNNEAYMRSGNMPVRYEVINEGARSYLTMAVGSTGNALPIADLTYFPDQGNVLVGNEVIRYTGKSASTGPGNLLVGQRAAPITYFQAGATRSFTAGPAANIDSGESVLLISMTATPSVSHWGSAFIQDGGFDDDRGYIFNYQATNIILSARKTTAFAIRLAPSVSNAITGDLGARELINRAQLLLSGIEITAGTTQSSQFSNPNTSTAIVIEGVLNPSNFPADPTRIRWYSLQGSPSGGNPLGTGQPSFSQIAPSGDINFDGTATITTTVSGNSAAGSRTISIATTASIQVGDVIYNNTQPASVGGNTTVTAIGTGNVTLSQPLLRQASNTDSVSFLRNQWAVPGETIFSFISNPSSKDGLDLTPLKELTNTPIGGRGCYPNGPDTLFINVYITQGIPVQANLVLRWAEAQA